MDNDGSPLCGPPRPTVGVRCGWDNVGVGTSVSSSWSEGMGDAKEMPWRIAIRINREDGRPEGRGWRTSGAGTRASRTPTCFACPRLFFLDSVQEGIRHAQVFNLFFFWRTHAPHAHDGPTPRTHTRRREKKDHNEHISDRRGGPLRAHRTPTNVALLELPEPIAVRARLIHLAEGDVHKVVAVDEMAVEGLAVFEFYKLGRRVSSCQTNVPSLLFGTRDQAVWHTHHRFVLGCGEQ